MSQAALVVTGFARCGTTMVMRMLHRGGMEVVADYYASYEADSLRVPNSQDWTAYAGKAVKVLDPHRWRFPVEQPVRFIFLSRDAGEQAKSLAKLLRTVGHPMTRVEVGAMARSLRRDYGEIHRHLRPHPALFLDFESILKAPREMAERIAEFAGRPLDVEAMARVVRPRSPMCRPDMSWELEMVAEEEMP